MRRSLSFLLVLAGAGLVAGCAAERPPMRRGMGPGMGGVARGGLFVSPAGEPFRRGAQGGEPPLGAWFAGADADHDGAIGWAEFEADFSRYFAVLDADRDGEIGPAEVTRYETEIFPEIASRGGGGRDPGAGMGRGRGAGMGRGRGGGGRGGGVGGGRGGGRAGGADMAGRMAMMAGAARFGLLPISHPIMDADANFNRGVTREEFAQAAARRFALLDQAHVGRLTLPELTAMRQRPGRPRPGAPAAAD
jgi:hypothetical protein